MVSRSEKLKGESMSSRNFHFGFLTRTEKLFLAILILLPISLQAQVTGTISGYVTDPSGAPVAGARVSATSVGRTLTQNSETNSEGFYNFPAVEPDVYTLAVEKSGFEQLIRAGLTLTVSQNLRVDFRLQVGSVTEHVTVTGEASLVDTTSAVLSGLVDDRRIVDLPLNGRNVLTLAAFCPEY